MVASTFGDTCTQPVMQAIVQSVRDAAQQYPKPAEFTPSYGTAGFRAKAELLTSTVFRWIACSAIGGCTVSMLLRHAQVFGCAGTSHAHDVRSLHEQRIMVTGVAC